MGDLADHRQGNSRGGGGLMGKGEMSLRIRGGGGRLMGKGEMSLRIRGGGGRLMGKGEMSLRMGGGASYGERRNVFTY